MESNENELWTAELIDMVKSHAKAWRCAFIVTLFLWFATIAGFLLYLNQYDFVSSYEQTGIYTLVDSKGNVISSDIDQDKIKEIMEIISNGKHKDQENAS